MTSLYARGNVWAVRPELPEVTRQHAEEIAVSLRRFDRAIVVFPGSAALWELDASFDEMARHGAPDFDPAGVFLWWTGWCCIARWQWSEKRLTLSIS